MFSSLLIIQQPRIDENTTFADIPKRLASGAQIMGDGRSPLTIMRIHLKREETRSPVSWLIWTHDLMHLCRESKIELDIRSPQRARRRTYMLKRSLKVVLIFKHQMMRDRLGRQVLAALQKWQDRTKDSWTCSRDHGRTFFYDFSARIVRNIGYDQEVIHASCCQTWALQNGHYRGQKHCTKPSTCRALHKTKTTSLLGLFSLWVRHSCGVAW